ncbi:DUF6210 family protein [Paenibacillus sp. sgz500958]|uniref:DUF6210 family protein n=1 Tax=Paenibacillus sp. sgz500958 TaxID=3242475 RepID=UPI0036D38905
MNQNREINLYGLEQIALIIKSKSGVTYTNQAGGYACIQPSVEGILTIVDDDTKTMLKELSEYTINKTTFNIDDAEFIDKLLQSNSGGKFLEIDRSKLEFSMEAWIHVIINYEKTENTILKGFNETQGILTWNNSD